MKRPLLLALFMLAAGPASAALLSEYSCARPPGVDEGTWHNVSVAAGLLNGSVLEPGAEFSFLALVAQGKGRFMPGNTLSGGRVIKSFGGGYCQVSSALYNAALLAGLEVTERYHHSFYEESGAYVEPGRDAAVSRSSGADFKFRNSTASALTIQAMAMDGRVAVQVYGEGPERARWISTQARRIPKRLRKNAQAPPRPGFDGWVVKRSLHTLDQLGNTLSAPLGTDRYGMVSEILPAEEETK